MIEHISPNGMYAIRRFSSVNDIVCVASKSSGIVENNLNFIGRAFSSPEHIFRSVDEFWGDGVKTIESMIEKVESTDIIRPLSRRRKRAWSGVEGDDFDYDRFQAQSPYWRSFKRGLRRGSSFELVTVDVGTTAYFSPDDILWRGAAAIVLAKILEASGRRCQIVTVNKTNRVYTAVSSLLASVVIKNASDSVNVNELAIAVSGWFYRTIIFLSRATMNNSVGSIGGVGGSVPPSASEIQELVGYPSFHIENVWSERAAVDLVRSHLSKLDSGMSRSVSSRPSQRPQP